MAIYERKWWYVLTPAGRVGPYLNNAAAHDAADPLGFSVFGVHDTDDDEDDTDEDESGDHGDL